MTLDSLFYDTLQLIRFNAARQCPEPKAVLVPLYLRKETLDNTNVDLLNRPTLFGVPVRFAMISAPMLIA